MALNPRKRNVFRGLKKEESDSLNFSSARALNFCCTDFPPRFVRFFHGRVFRCPIIPPGNTFPQQFPPFYGTDYELSICVLNRSRFRSHETRLFNLIYDKFQNFYLNSHKNKKNVNLLTCCWFVPFAHLYRIFSWNRNFPISKNCRFLVKKNYSDLVSD